MGVKYVFPDKTASIGVDYGRLQSTNVVVAGQKLSPTAVTGDWAAHIYGITSKVVLASIPDRLICWLWTKIGP
ncbi:hypothetical protein [Arsenophonus endosymbiont of Bemisia tabaci]|uniref:hypothetical protein n=1 Tax=Arsenophonus endosymbiont of Bemisia tabaci TaxID=536059 RepID=UPI0015F48C01|nr:hypothetical protein [Arsenophonus endosymbiont of Bemisia tabaci]